MIPIESDIYPSFFLWPKEMIFLKIIIYFFSFTIMTLLNSAYKKDPIINFIGTIYTSGTPPLSPQNSDN